MGIVLTIIAHTPIWVFPLIAAVLWLGIVNLRERILPPPLLLVLPAVMLLLSIGNATATSAEPRLALASWLAAVSIGAIVGWAVTVQPPAIKPGSRKIIVPGSVVPLLVCIGLIVLRYTFGYLYGRYPELRADGDLALLLIAGGALLGGVALGRFGRLCLWYWRNVSGEMARRARTNT